jgi:predicted transcriptional regulator
MIFSTLYAIFAIANTSQGEKNMAKTVTTRLDDEYVNKIDEMAAKKGIDRSALLRLFLVNSIKEQTVQDSLESYKSGTITLWEAAQNCNLTLWERIAIFDFFFDDQKASRLDTRLFHFDLAGDCK